jgi:hypothetical protein
MNYLLDTSVRSEARERIADRRVVSRGRSPAKEMLAVRGTDADGA